VAIGSPLFGWWSEKVRNRKLPLISGSIIGLVVSILIIYFQMNLFFLYIALILYGISSAGQALIFAVMKDVTDKNLIGTGIGLVNMAVVASGLIFQPLIGFLLNTFKNVGIQSASDGIAYSLTDFRYSLTAIPVIFIVSLLILFFMKETYTDAEK
jgi:MFS family permease